MSSVACPVAEDMVRPVAADQPAGQVRRSCAKQLWVGGYVPGWNQGKLDLKHNRALDAITYFLHFAVYFRPRDGRLDLAINELSPARMKALVSTAHRQGKQALLVIGGEGAAPGLRIATGPGRLEQTIRSIISLVNLYGYDGLDVDWEPLSPQDAGLYSGLIQGLSRELATAGPRKGRRLALTTAIEVDLNDEEYMSSLFQVLRELDGILDRIELMTYTMANPEKLPFVWHSSALYPSATLAQAGFRTPSADSAVRAFVAAGIPSNKLGIGIN